MTFAESILSLLRTLRIDATLPKGVEVLNPYQDANVMKLCASFYDRFYNDTRPRRLIVGINPGRFGGGITGIPFTDPIKLATVCGIPNDLGRRTELSADFIYRVIEEYGGPQAFYASFYITAVSPLGFVRDNKNLNYYDVKELQEAITPFAVQSMNSVLEAPVDKTKCYCIGEGDNYKFLLSLNKTHGWFDEIIPLPHPRFVMQYRRKQLQHHVDNYLTKLSLP